MEQPPLLLPFSQTFVITPLSGFGWRLGGDPKLCSFYLELLTR